MQRFISILILVTFAALVGGCKDNTANATRFAKQQAKQQAAAKARAEFLTDAKFYAVVDGRRLPIKMYEGRPNEGRQWYFVPFNTKVRFELTDLQGNPHPRSDDIMYAFSAPSLDLDILLKRDAINIGATIGAHRISKGVPALYSRSNPIESRSTPYFLGRRYVPQEFPGLVDWTLTAPENPDEPFELEMVFESTDEFKVGSDGGPIQELYIGIRCYDSSRSSDVPGYGHWNFYPYKKIGKKPTQNTEGTYREAYGITSSLDIKDERAVLKTSFMVRQEQNNPIVAFDITTRDEKRRLFTVDIPVPINGGTLSSKELGDPSALIKFDPKILEPISAEEIATMSRSEARSRFAEIAKVRDHPDITTELRERLSEQMDLLSQRSRDNSP